MTEQILEGVSSGLQKLIILGVGYFLFWTGKYLVNDWGSESSSSKGMPKWKAALVAPVVGVILGFLAVTPSTIWEGEDPLFGGGEVVDVIEVEKPYKAFCSVFVFSCVAMWFGVAKSKRSYRRTFRYRDGGGVGG